MLFCPLAAPLGKVQSVPLYVFLAHIDESVSNIDWKLSSIVCMSPSSAEKNFTDNPAIQRVLYITKEQQDQVL